MKCRKCETEFDGNFCPTCGAKKEMKCKKCGAEYVGDFCTNCGAKTDKRNKLFGFRSNRWYKKILSVMYMIVVAMAAIGSVSTIDSANDAVTTIGILLSMLVPYIFLSDFKYRKYLPLFKKHRIGSNILGMICVYIAIPIVFSVLNPATYCEHDWVEVENKQATCTEQGYKKTHCDLCDSDSTEYITIEHEWVETERKQATCVEDGYIKKNCALCNSENTETIDKTEHQYNVTEESEEKVVEQCSSCGGIRIEDKKKSKGDEAVSSTDEPKEKKHKHEWEKATCEKPATCLTCGETKDTALGHTTDLGVCSRCNQEFRKTSPVTILGWSHSTDFLGGVEWSFRIKNNTDKQIKYVTLEWDCYNAVGDLIYNELGWGSSVRVRFTGPLDAYATSGKKHNADRFYNHELKNYKMTEILVEYMDGTTERVNQYHDKILG